MGDLAALIVDGESTDDAFAAHGAGGVPECIGASRSGKVQRTSSERRRGVGLSRRVVARGWKRARTSRIGQPLRGAHPASDCLTQGRLGGPHSADDEADPEIAPDERPAKGEIFAWAAAADNCRRPKRACEFGDLFGGPLVECDHLKWGGARPRERRDGAGADRRRERARTCRDEEANRGRVTRGVQYQNVRDIGDPIQYARKYDLEGADELVFYDITASSDGYDDNLGAAKIIGVMVASTALGVLRLYCFFKAIAITSASY